MLFRTNPRRRRNPPQSKAIMIRKTMGPLCCGHLLHRVRHGRRRSAITVVKKMKMIRQAASASNANRGYARKPIRMYRKYQDATCMKRTIPAYPTDLSMYSIHCLLFRPRLSKSMTLHIVTEGEQVKVNKSIMNLKHMQKIRFLVLINC